MGDLGHTEPAHGAAEASAGWGGFPGHGRSQGLLGPVVLAGGPARPGPAALGLSRPWGSGSAGSAHRAGGGECGRGARAGLRAAGLVPGAQGAAPEMAQAGISRPACRDAGLEPRPAGLGWARGGRTPPAMLPPARARPRARSQGAGGPA